MRLSKNVLTFSLSRSTVHAILPTRKKVRPNTASPIQELREVAVADYSKPYAFQYDQAWFDAAKISVILLIRGCTGREVQIGEGHTFQIPALR